MVQLKLKLETTERDFEKKESQYTYKIKELEAVSKPLPIQLRKVFNFFYPDNTLIRVKTCQLLPRTHKTYLNS